MQLNSKIFVAGHRGLVGSAIVRQLTNNGYTNIVTRTRAELDLIDDDGVFAFFEQERPEFVFLAAAKVGGIMANKTYPVDFFEQNVRIQSNIIRSSHLTNVQKLLFLGSSCIYPKVAEIPIKEESLLTGHLEPTNSAYAIAKIAGIEQCKAYHQQYGFNSVCAMPCNLYGVGDNFDLQSSHVLPALIRKIHEAKVNGIAEVEMWGSGRPLREFLFSDDLAEGLIYLMNANTTCEVYNMGYSADISIADVANVIKDVVGFTGTFKYDPSKPDGTFRKLIDSSKINALGWKPATTLVEGIRKTYEWYLSTV